MLLFDIIGEFIIEVVLIDFIGGVLIKANNGILKLRGIEPRSEEEIKHLKIKKRYLYKKVTIKNSKSNIKKGTTGIVLDVLSSRDVILETVHLAEKKIHEIPIKDIY